MCPCTLLFSLYSSAFALHPSFTLFIRMQTATLLLKLLLLHCTASGLLPFVRGVLTSAECRVLSAECRVLSAVCISLQQCYGQWTPLQCNPEQSPKQDTVSFTVCSSVQRAEGGGWERPALRRPAHCPLCPHFAHCTLCTHAARTAHCPLWPHFHTAICTHFARCTLCTHIAQTVHSARSAHTFTLHSARTLHIVHIAHIAHKLQIAPWPEMQTAHWPMLHNRSTLAIGAAHWSN